MKNLILFAIPAQLYSFSLFYVPINSRKQTNYVKMSQDCSIATEIYACPVTLAPVHKVTKFYGAFRDENWRCCDNMKYYDCLSNIRV